jgi:RNA polymerase sigma factor (sigma-70 family)
METLLATRDTHLGYASLTLAASPEQRGALAPTDTELVSRCLKRERGAWEALVDRYADLVYGIAKRTGLDGAAAEDVVQEVCLLLLKNLHRVRNRERLTGWIAKTARREAWRTARRQRAARAREARTSAPDLDVAPLPDEVVAEMELRHLVRQALDTLDPRCRELLDALFLRGETDYRQLGEELDMPIGSIGPTRRRCLDKLLPALDALGLSPPDVSGGRSSASRKAGPRSRKKGAS